MGECLVRGEFVKDLVGQPAGLAAELAEELADLGPCHPDQGRVGPLDAGQGLVQRSQAGADGADPIAQEAADLLVEDATLAGPRAQLPGLFAGRAAAPEARVGVKAPGAQRFLTDTPADRGHGAAPGAGCPPLLAAVAPRLAGGLGYLAPRGPSADSAGQDLARPAVLAPRPVCEPDRDRAAASAVRAFLKIDRVADQVRTQRIAVSIPGGRFTDTTAARARDGSGPGEAVPADALTIQQLRQGFHLGAAQDLRVVLQRLGEPPPGSPSPATAVTTPAICPAARPRSTSATRRTMTPTGSAMTSSSRTALTRRPG